MVIDSSALIAILLKEEEAQSFAYEIEQSASRLLSACTLVETFMVIESRVGGVGVKELERLIERHFFDVIPFNLHQASLAQHAFLAYGKGRHKAGLNMGDCFSYALSKAEQLPLLFKGNDFIHTDITPAI